MTRRQIGDTTVFLSNGDGTFMAKPTVAAPTALSSPLVATGDFTGSGRTDVAEQSNGIITILLSDGEGHFDAGQQITSGRSHRYRSRITTATAGST